MPTPSGRRPRLLAGVLALLALAGLSACDPASAADTPAPPRRGGTLHVNIQGGLELLDPQRTNNPVERDVLRLLTRTLTTFRSEAGGEIVPDLATDTGRPSGNNMVWRFSLKPNVRWEGGELVTCSQIKYGIQRRFSPLINEGATYPLVYLQDNPKHYLGPWLDGDNQGKGLESIQCLDERTIQFTLASPAADFGQMLALTTFAPVLPAKDAKDRYTDRPYSNGPYKIKSRTPDGLVLERNTYWSEANDQVRRAYPDSIVIDYRQDTGGVISNEVIENQGAARNTIMLDGNVKPNFQQQVANDAALMRRVVAGPTGRVQWLAINSARVPDLQCRQALVYAFDQRAWRAALGGSLAGGFATTLLSPALPGHKDFDFYHAREHPDGDPATASALLGQQQTVGRPCARTLRVAYPASPDNRRLLSTLVRAYRAVGVEVQTVALAPTAYYSTGVGDPSNTYDLMLVSRGPDWASGSALLPALFASTSIPPVNPLTGRGRGNANWSMLRDPGIDQALQNAVNETTPERQRSLWAELDQQLAQLAVTVPTVYENAFRITGSNVAGGFIHPTLGLPDLATLGLADPTLS